MKPGFFAVGVHWYRGKFFGSQVEETGWTVLRFHYWEHPFQDFKYLN